VGSLAAPLAAAWLARRPQTASTRSSSEFRTDV
jgi:hypothetical protein